MLNGSIIRAEILYRFSPNWYNKYGIYLQKILVCIKTASPPQPKYVFRYALFKKNTKRP